MPTRHSHHVACLLVLVALLSGVVQATSAAVPPGADRWLPAGPAGVGPIRAVAVDPEDGEILHLATAEGVYTSRDAGATWLLTPIPGLQAVAASPAEPRRLYAVEVDGTRVRLWRSDDRGVGWRPAAEVDFQPPTGGIAAVRLGSLALSTADPDVLFCGVGLEPSLGVYGGTGGAVLRSVDGGGSVSQLAPPPVDETLFADRVPEALLLAADGSLLAANSDGVFRAPSAADAEELDWQPSSTGLGTGAEQVPIAVLAGHPTDPQSVWAVAERFDGARLVYRSTDAGGTWSPLAGVTAAGVGPPAGRLAVDPDDGRTVFVRVGGRVFVTYAGEAFSPLAAVLPASESGPLVVAPTSPRTLYAAVGSDLMRLVPPPPPCVDDPLTFCLGERFRVDLVWRSAGGGRGSGHAEPLTLDGGWFWFFHRDNPEVLFKVLDGRPVNGHWWVFLTALTDVAFDLRVVDTASGRVRVFSGLPGGFTSRAETAAFPMLQDSLASRAPLWFAALPEGTCDDPAAVCLHDGRFEVRVDWHHGERHAAGDSLTRRAGWFWFFRPGNPEVLVKVLDGRPVNGHWWVFFGSLTDVAYEVTVTDTVGGSTWEGGSPGGVLTSIGDTAAFPAVP